MRSTCLKCGGKMKHTYQTGGFRGRYYGRTDEATYADDYVNQAMQAGILAYPPQQAAQKISIPYAPMQEKDLVAGSDIPYPEENPTPAMQQQRPPRNKRPLNFNPTTVLRGASTAAQFFGGILERGRQNQYMMQQLSTLGQLDPIPVSNFQPNPYSLYARKGGWIQKAVNPEHKGFCTPMSKPTCTPRRKALARRFKAMAKD